MQSSRPTTLFFVAAHALIQYGDNYLIIRRCSNADYGGSQWELPGGIVEPGETVEEALVREIKEETGLTVDVVRLMRVYTNRDSLPARQHVEITYQCIYRSGKIRLAPSEHDSFEWLRLNDLRKLRFTTRGFLADLLSSPDSLATMEAIEAP